MLEGGIITIFAHKGNPGSSDEYNAVQALVWSMRGNGWEVSNTDVDADDADGIIVVTHVRKLPADVM
ncbi:hypothetical protein WJX73_000893 [Symbiochloris irregularis]|uniref:GP-PDE domain-containing protein n=1 Tax=Symbiochloris irregularis TaxID=706552 RepID=A0AAW1NS08_9CHLO